MGNGEAYSQWCTILITKGDFKNFVEIQSPVITKVVKSTVKSYLASQHSLFDLPDDVRPVPL